MKRRKAAVIVAHPDDETLWSGGTILHHPHWDWFVACMCRASDADRAPRFYRALGRLGAGGAMADLDDGPDQAPLPREAVAEAIRALVPATGFDVVITHGLDGEYTRHRRHEETGRAAAGLWQAGRLAARELWLFAYDDDGGRRLPRAVAAAHKFIPLPDAAWRGKYRIITEVYGFGPDSFEARAAPRTEAFWCFNSPGAFGTWVAQQGERP